MTSLPDPKPPKQVRIRSIGDLYLTGDDVICGMCLRPLHLLISEDAAIHDVVLMHFEDGNRISQNGNVIHQCHGLPEA
jgi:hypothetical protein